MKRIRAWPTAPMIAFVCAVLGGLAAATLVSYYRSTTPVVPNAADVNRLDDQIGNNKSAAGAASTNRSETSASPPVSATDRPLITKTEQQAGNSSSAKRQAPTQPKNRNANRSRVEFKGPPVRKP